MLGHPGTAAEIAGSGCSPTAAVDQAISAAAALHAHGGWSSWPLGDRLALLGDLVGKLEGLEDPLTVADAIDSGQA
jgi:hypothetical protein